LGVLNPSAPGSKVVLPIVNALSLTPAAPDVSPRASKGVAGFSGAIAS
jgi:hypothetical protein